MQRVPRRWAGKGPAATLQIIRFKTDVLAPFNHPSNRPGSELQRRLNAPKPSWSRARCPHRSRDTPQVRPFRLLRGIHAA
ncbi:hypothetical protein XHV734_1307 [Xanthomonas hortorum pv. vitians]|nr:hypothetical protein XHV734_1307 [Xanthomonas hortorum pv. vitians]